MNKTANKYPSVKSFTMAPVEDTKWAYVRSYNIPQPTEAKLRMTKSKYDKPYLDNPQLFHSITRHFRLETDVRSQISKAFNTPNVTNAWLKGYEMFTHYKLIPSLADHFVYFDNAAFPGAFILAAWHIANTFSDINKFEWHGSSLIDEGDNKGALLDKYDLYKNYPKNWRMSKLNNGDVTCAENQKNWDKYFNKSVDLYTSDLGFDVSSDYNKQEELQAHANLGQILTGLTVLKNGGSMITKQFTCYTPFTISLIGVLTTMFEKVDICKPMFSKPGNSEVYVVCLNYKHSIAQAFSIRKLVARLKKFNLKPLITKQSLGDAFIKSTIEAQSYFSNTQIRHINRTIDEYNKFAKSKRKSSPVYIKNNNSFAAENKTKLDVWKKNNVMIELKDSRKLNVVEKYVKAYYTHDIKKK
jgi:cap2 methyltransferase